MSYIIMLDRPIIERVLKSAKRHPVVLLMVALAACAAFLTEMPKDIAQIGRWLVSGLTNRRELKLLEQIDTGLSCQKVENILGILTTESKNDRYDITTYVCPLYRLVLIYEHKTVVAFSIMTRHRRFNPKILIGKDHAARLGKSTFSEFIPGHLSVAKWEVSTVPKDIMYYETVYLGNAKNYETCLLAYSWSPGAVYQFALQYQIPILNRFGLVCYGCCEPLDTKFDLLIRHLPRLRRVSVSPWCDRKIAAEKLTSRYIYSWKPNPAGLCGPTVDYKALEDDIRSTLDIAQGCCIEIVMKDTHTFNGDPARIERWSRIASSLADEAAV
ncbi:MAG: ETEC_3214 domain-containing protein [Planctomycetota bacterium]